MYPYGGFDNSEVMSCLVFMKTKDVVSKEIPLRDHSILW